MTTEAGIAYCNMPIEMFTGSKYPVDNIYADDQILQCFVSPLSKKGNAAQLHIGVLNEGKVLSFSDINAKMRKEETIENYLVSLEEKITELIQKNVKWESDEDAVITVRFGQVDERGAEESASTTFLRILVMIKDFLPISKDDELQLRKKVLGEINNWVEEVMHDVPYEAPKEDYSNDITVKMSVDMIPHEKASTDADSTMTILAIVFAILGIFLHEYYIFGVMAVVVGICFGIRSFQHEHYVCLGLCVLAALIGICTATWEYLMFQNNVKETTANLLISLRFLLK